tara:strand:- start:2322 stop:3443 length:1122 start_codon:yes stop_codon:yes gene_type:complete
MRILFITQYGGLYGSNQSLLTLLSELKAIGIHVSVISPDIGPFTDELDTRKISYTVIKFYPLWIKSYSIVNLLKVGIKSFLNYLKIPQAARFANSNSCDIIYTNSSVSGFGYDLALRIGKPHVWHFREFGYLDYGLSYYLGKRIFIQKVNNPNNHIIFISNALRDHYHEIKKGSVVYNGIIKCSELKQTYSENFGVYKFSFIGLLHRAKNVSEIIKAFAIANIENSILNIYGDTQDKYYKSSLMETIRSYGLQDRIIFHGFVKNKTVIYQNTDCLVMASHNEGFGRVTAEAMANGVVVIGYDGGGTREVIKDKETGYLYQGDEYNLAEIMKYVNHNRERNKIIIENALLEVKERFTIESYIKKILDFLEKITN